MSIQDYIEEYSKKKSITSTYTKKSISSNIKRVEKSIGIKFENWKESDFKNVEKVVDNLVEDYSLNSVLVSISTIKSWLMYHEASEELIKEYNNVVNDLAKEKDNLVDSQKKSKDEEDLGEDFDWKILTEKSRKFIEKNLPTKDKTKLRGLLILGLFSLQEPTRIGNYLDMEYRKMKSGESLPKDKNYLINNNGKFKFIFNTYKTSKYLGQVVLPVEDELLTKLLTDYSEFLKNKDIVFGQSSSNISFILKNITKHFLKTGISLNPFRHSYLTWFLKQNPSINEKQRVARIIGQKYTIPRMEKYSRID